MSEKKKYSCYEYSVEPWDEDKSKFVYTIYGEDSWIKGDGIIESGEWYDTEFQAQMGAIGHIDLLENGEG